MTTPSGTTHFSVIFAIYSLLQINLDELPLFNKTQHNRDHPVFTFHGFGIAVLH